MAIATPQVKTDRLHFIDLIRGLAVIFMVEAHVINSCLNPAYRTGGLFTTLDIFNGFVSVAFIFCAGAGFQLALEKKKESFRTFERPLWIYVRRLLFILALAYWLHLPTHSLTKYLSFAPAEMNSLFQFDVLQVIVTCSFIGLAFGLLPLRVGILRVIYIFLAAAIFLATPFVWEWHPEHILPAIFSMPFIEQPISKFPLFPWGGYFFAGAAVMGFLLQSEHRRRFAAILACCAFVVAVIASHMEDFHLYYGGWDDWWRTSPEHSLYRLAGVIAAFGVLFLLEQRIAPTRTGTILRHAGQESLGFYVVHLLIVYGSVVNPGITKLLAERLTLAECFALTLLIIAITYTIITVWHRLRLERPVLARRLVIAAAAIFLLVFLLAPGY